MRNEKLLECVLESFDRMSIANSSVKINQEWKWIRYVFPPEEYSVLDSSKIDFGNLMKIGEMGFKPLIKEDGSFYIDKESILCSREKHTLMDKVIGKVRKVF